MNSVNFLDALTPAFQRLNVKSRRLSAIAAMCTLGEIKKCPMCFKAHIRQKYCSHECTRRAQGGGTWKSCKICGTRTANKQTCSDGCRAEYKKLCDVEYYQTKGDQRRQYAKEYYERVKDSDQHKAKQLRSSRALNKRRREDPILRLESAIRARVMMSMKRRNANKGGRTFELIGCTGAELAAHIEKQFKRGMTWDNYGSAWHVDHITPLSYFDMSNPDDQRRAWNWQNLRPLPAIQNIKEGNKRGECQTFLPLCN